MTPRRRNDRLVKQFESELQDLFPDNTLLIIPEKRFKCYILYINDLGVILTPKTHPIYEHTRNFKAKSQCVICVVYRSNPDARGFAGGN